MAIILQNDLGTVNDANSYIDIAFFDSYFSIRNIEVDDFDADQKEFAIIKATDYIDYRFLNKIIGAKLNQSQTTQFPRDLAIGNDGYVYNSIIPNDVKKACCEYSLIVLNGSELSPNPEYQDNGQNIKTQTVKVGPITETITYKDDFEKNLIRSYIKADMYMANFIKNINVGYLVRA